MNILMGLFLVSLSVFLILPWLAIVIVPILIPIMLILFAAFKLIDQSSELSTFSNSKIESLLHKYIYQLHVADGADVHIEETKDGKILLCARFITSGLHWGLKVKGQNMEDAIALLEARIDNICKRIKFKMRNFDTLLKNQYAIDRSSLFSLRYINKEDIHMGKIVMT